MFVGTVHGGPVYGSTASRPVTPAYLLCTPQVDGPHHDGPDVVSTTAWGIGATSVPPTPITFQLQPGDVTRMCAEVLVDVPASGVVCSSGAETVLEDVWDCSGRAAT